MSTEEIKLEAHDLRVFRCGYWVIQCGPNQSWKFLERPDGGPHIAASLKLEDAKQLALISHAARLWLQDQPKGHLDGSFSRP